MFWAVLILDLTGMQFSRRDPPHPHPVRSLLTVPLALGLNYTLRLIQAALAATALTCRLFEASLGILSTTTAFTTVRSYFESTGFGASLLRISA